jgi:inner membrane protein
MPLVVVLDKHMFPYDMKFLIPAAIGTFIGALLPDIDHQNAYISKKLGIFSKLFKNLKHRTYTHSIFFPLLIALLGKIHFIFYFVAFGALMHIIEDFLTKGGVPLFYPFIKQRFSANMFVTGGKGEYFFVFIVSFLVITYSLSF